MYGPPGGQPGGFPPRPGPYGAPPRPYGGPPGRPPPGGPRPGGPPGQQPPGFVEGPKDIVAKFATYLYGHITRKNVEKIQYMYQVNYTYICDHYFHRVRLEPPEFVANVIGDDQVFIMLYKELAFRHVYKQGIVSVYERIDSWANYCALWHVVLQEELNMQLPIIWLYDMMDEFCYQFQAFCQYRARISKKTAEEVEVLEANPKAWSPALVLDLLHRLVEASGVVAILEKDGGQELFETNGQLPGSGSNVRLLLGYFSLLGLLRIYTLIGDYHMALQSLYPLNPHQWKWLFSSKVAPAHVTLFYYAGFSYLMLGRYPDATRTFSAILTHVQRHKSQMQKGLNATDLDLVLKKTEQMYALLAMTIALQPACMRLITEESVSSQLREKYGDKIQKIQQGEVPQKAREEPAVVELFQYACPKFVTTYAPDYGRAGQYDTHQDNYRTQLSVFMKQVQYQERLMRIKQFLRLYTSITLSKLASLLELPVPDVRHVLIYMKNRNIALRHDGQSDLTQGRLVAFTDVEFHLDFDTTTGEEIVVVADAKPVKRHVDQLLRNITKLNELVVELENPESVQPRGHKGGGPKPAAGADKQPSGQQGGQQSRPGGMYGTPSRGPPPRPMAATG